MSTEVVGVTPWQKLTDCAQFSPCSLPRPGEAYEKISLWGKDSTGSRSMESMCTRGKHAFVTPPHWDSGVVCHRSLFSLTIMSRRAHLTACPLQRYITLCGETRELAGLWRTRTQDSSLFFCWSQTLLLSLRDFLHWETPKRPINFQNLLS